MALAKQLQVRAQLRAIVEAKLADTSTPQARL